MTRGTAITPFQMTEPPVVVTRTLGNALITEGTHTEPTIGQIWPR